MPDVEKDASLRDTDFWSKVYRDEILFKRDGIYLNLFKKYLQLVYFPKMKCHMPVVTPIYNVGLIGLRKKRQQGIY